jgi:hypothetical protein
MQLQDIVTQNKVITQQQLEADSELLKEVQSKLAALGLYPTDLIDGIDGPKTQGALASFCDSTNLNNASTGLYGATFAKALLGAKKRGVTPQDVLNIARKEIGYKETGNNRNKFGAWYGMNGQPWCAMFVSYCFYTAGMPLPITTDKGFAYCPYGVNWFKQQGCWFKSPKVGDIVLFDFGRKDGIADHVGIVEKVNADGTITTIEGNTSSTAHGSQSNGGCVARRIRSLNVVQGFGRPAYL